MYNINRDYLIVLNPKTSKVTVPELNYYIYDKYTANLFVNLVTVENGKAVNIPDADQYKLVLHVLKPTNEIQTVEDIQVFNKEKALFQIELDQELTKNIGRYKCELLTIDKTDHVVQSAKFSYRVKKSIYNDLDVVTETPQYPIIITLLDKLQDIDKYEEERRANEVARVAAEKARVKDYTDLRQTVTTDIDTMQEKIDSFDGKVQEVDNAVQQMRTNITNYQAEKNKELDSYKTQKDTQINTSIKNMENTIDTYKTEKDKQINDKITQQDTKIDKAIDLQNKNIQASTKALNDKLDAAVQDQNNTIAANNQAQNKVISDAVAAQNKTINTVVESDKVQNDRLDTLETNDTNNKAEIKKLQDTDVEHEERMTAIEAVNVEQNNRLDAIEIKNDQQDSRLNDVEAKNKKQDLDLKCLFAESHSERITLEDEVGNSVFLQNSKQGFATVDELKGNTLVNCNKDTDKELILNGNIDTSGYGTVTTTEGVDGGLVDVMCEGNTMVNVCDQEEPIAITKNYEVTTGNHVALQGEYNGKCRPVLNGNTLVNILPKFKTSSKNYIGTNPYDVDEEGYATINATGDWIKPFVTNMIKTPLLKYDTIYTIICDVKENTLTRTNANKNTVFDICSTGVEEALIKSINGEFSYQIGETGRKIVTVQTKAQSQVTLGTDKIFFPRTQVYNIVNSGYIKYRLICLEGDYTNKPIPDYFTGLQSSFEDKLITDEKDANNGKYKVDYKVTGKNKFNKSKTLDGYEINNIGAGTIAANDKWFVTDFIPAIPNTTYAISGKGNGNTVMCYDENKQFIYGIANGGISQITTPSNVRYIKLNGLLTQKDTFQIEEGTKATTYEPYKEYTKTFYLNSPLLEGDTIEQSGNNIVHMHRYNTITFDGSDDEKWVYWGNNTDNGELDSSLISFYLPFTNYKDFRTSTVFNNKFLMENTVWGAKTEIMALNADNIMSFQVALLRSKLATQNVAGFKTWLQANPITVAYELATPTREVISTNNNLLLDSYVNGHLDVDSVIPIERVNFKPSWIYCKYVYTNTEYTIQFEADNVGTLNLHFSGGDKNNNSIIKGINKINITTTNDTAYLQFSGIGFNMSNIVVTPKVEQTFGYFKGMKSVGECEDLEVVSSNNDNTLSNKQTMTHEPLRGLPNGVKDKYVIIDGKWYIERNCGKYVSTGNEYIYTYTATNNNAVSYIILNDYFNTEGSSVICDKECTVVQGWSGYSKGVSAIRTNNENRLILSQYNTEQCKALLKQQLTFIYELAQPTYEPLEIESTLTTYNDTTHISNNSNIPCNMVIRNSGFNCILKPNTTYTISSNNGLSSVVTKDSIGDSVLRFYDKDTTSVTKMNNVLVLEGDYITGNPPIPAFFKGMESTFEQELVTDEKDKNYGKYKVNVKATNPDNSQQNNITFYLKEPLRGVGDVKDKVYVKEDKVMVERNCVSYVLDPNKIPSPSPCDTKLYMYNIAANNSIINTRYGKVVCNSFACDVNNAHDRSRANTISTVVDGTVPNGVIRIITDKNKETLKQYLQQNPTTVIYQLATPVYEEVEYFDLKLFVEIFKDTTIIYNSNIPVTSTINYTYSTPLTDAVNTVSDISDQQDSMIIDMATQVATMEMMLM